MYTPIAPLITLGAILASSFQVATPLAFDHNILKSRATINPPSLSESYDFIVIGGGLAGLVVAARLAENSTTTILVIEAGGTGDDVADTINHPGNAYYAGLVGSTHDWAWTSVPQTSANNRVMNWPGGKLLGGSSAINGCYLVRPSSVEVDAWQTLISGMDGADNWTSDKLFAAMRKSEDFTPPTDEIKAIGQIEYNEASHGTQGPLHASYPDYMPAVVGQWTSTLANIGIHTNADPAGGDASGAFVTTSTINPANWTRSYSKSAYIDPFYRPNLHILTDNQVNRIIFSGTTATGVEYGTDKKTVNVNKEVIVSAGPVSSPATLMRSGVGPQDVLNAAGVTTVLALPGVGQHLQDHLASQVVFSTNVETAGMIHSNTSDPRSSTAEFLSYVNSAIAYANTNDLVGDPNSYSSDLLSQLDVAVANLPSTDPTVIAGYKAVYQVSADQLVKSSSGQVELLLALNGQTINIQAALQRPLSHGRLYINSSDPTVPPVIDPHYMVHPSDLTMLREGLKLARSIGMTEPLNASITGEVTPGTNVTSDADLDAWLLNDFHTEFHPSCSCSMLPLEQGGVVDAHLKVHGLNNVRVVDSSVFPIEWSAHMMAPTYGLAEQAAEIILAQYSGSSSTSTSNQPTQSSTHHSGSIPQTSLHSWIYGLFIPLLAAVSLL